MDASVAVVYVLHPNILQVNFFFGGGVDGGGVNTSVLFKLMTYCKRTNNHFNFHF